MMERKEALRRLSNSAVFSDLKGTVLQEILQVGELMDFAPGRELIIEGQLSERLFVILAGEVEVVLPAGQRRRSEIKLGILAYGDTFGEYSWLDGEPASATIRTTTQTTVFAMSSKTMEDLVEAMPQLALVIYRGLLYTLVRRLRRNNREIDLLGRTIHERH